MTSTNGCVTLIGAAAILSFGFGETARAGNAGCISNAGSLVVDNVNDYASACGTNSAPDGICLASIQTAISCAKA